MLQLYNFVYCHYKLYKIEFVLKQKSYGKTKKYFESATKLYKVKRPWRIPL